MFSTVETAKNSFLLPFLTLCFAFSMPISGSGNETNAICVHCVAPFRGGKEM